MADGAEKPGHNRGLSLHGAQMVALRVSFALGNVFRTPRRQTTDPPARGVVQNPAAAAFAGAVLGCLTTLYLTAFGIAPGIASAMATSLICGQVLIMRAASLLPADFFTAVYGGSFGGMTPVLLLYEGGAEHSVALTSVLFISLSVVSGVVFGIVAEIDARADRRLASGYGGRAGTIATLASFLFVAVATMFGADARLFRGLTADMLELDPTSAALTCAACAIGLFATMTVLRSRSVTFVHQADRIFLASAVALIGMAGLHLYSPNDARLLDAFYAGCFLGMSTPERLRGWFAPLVGALVLTAMLVLVRTLLPGLGGSLGLAAFATVMVLKALSTFRATPEVHASRRAAGRIAYPMAGVVAFGCVVLLVSAPQQPAPDQATSAEAAMQATPGPVLPPLVLAGSHEANDAAALDAPAVPAAGAGSVDLAISLELPHDMKLVERALPENGEQPSPELSNAAVPATRDAGIAEATASPSQSETLHVGRTVESQPASLETIDAPTRAGSGGAAPVMAESQRSPQPVDDAADTDEKLFREFLQWRAARTGGAAQGRPQAVRVRTRPAPFGGQLIPAAVQARPAVGSPPGQRPLRPPRPVRNVAGNPAPNAAH